MRSIVHSDSGWQINHWHSRLRAVWARPRFQVLLQHALILDRGLSLMNKLRTVCSTWSSSCCSSIRFPREEPRYVQHRPSTSRPVFHVQVLHQPVCRWLFNGTRKVHFVEKPMLNTITVKCHVFAMLICHFFYCYLWPVWVLDSDLDN